MKYIKRILMLPFVVIAFVFSASFLFIKNGGEISINLKNKPDIDPKELISLLRNLNANILTLIEETK